MVRLAMRRGFGRGGFRGGGAGGPSGGGFAVLAFGAIILLLWGAWEAYYLARLFHEGARAHGHIVSVDREHDDTRIRVGDAECPVTGDVGPVGHAVEVVYPRGRPIECVVRSPNAFRWSAGAMLLGGTFLGVVWYQLRRDA